MRNTTVVIRGGGDLGTGVAHTLFKNGFDILVLEIENPLVIRRKVAFAQALFKGQTVVEDVKAVKEYYNRDYELKTGTGVKSKPKPKPKSGVKSKPKPKPKPKSKK